jgi:hypothetical protein
MLKVDFVHSGLLTMSVWDMSNKITIAIAIIAIIAVITAAIAGIPVLAKKKHMTAYELGSHDADPSTCINSHDCDLYITKLGKGFADHSKEFNKNYIKGFCAAGDGGSDADEATFDCSRDNK